MPYFNYLIREMEEAYSSTFQRQLLLLKKIKSSTSFLLRLSLKQQMTFY